MTNETRNRISQRRFERNAQQETLEDMLEHLERMSHQIRAMAYDITAIRRVATTFGVLAAIAIIIGSCSLLGL